jgi:hypothetical protein
MWRKMSANQVNLSSCIARNTSPDGERPGSCCFASEGKNYLVAISPFASSSSPARLMNPADGL